MDNKLKILSLEDSVQDYELIVETLRDSGFLFEISRVENSDDFISSIYKEQFDLILADNKLHGFDAFSALKHRMNICPDVPFICVSGSIGEDKAIDLIKNGATDYVLKDRLQRLPLVIDRALKESELNLLRKKALDDLKQSEEDFRKLFEDHAAAKLIIDPVNGNIIDANHAASDFYGWSRDELKKMNILQIDTLPSEKLFMDFQKTLSRKRFHFEFQHRLSDGTVKDVEIYCSAINMKEGKYLHSIIHDITQRKYATNELRKLSRAIEQSPASVIITDINGNIEYVNPKFTELTGYSFEEVKRMNPRILKSGYTSESEYKDLWKTISAGNEWRGEFQNKRKDGSLYWEHATISPIKNKEGQIINYLAVKEDITEKKRILEELTLAKNEAEESSRLKSAFLANISHEIRTPLNGIMGFANLLKKTALSEEDKESYLNILNESSIRMLNTINDIIEMSKIEAKQVSLINTETNIYETLKYLYVFFKPEADKKGLHFSLINKETDEQIFMLVDSNKLESILSNLLKNAIKFTQNGFVEFGYKRGNNDIQFFVRDSGEGIPPNRLKSVFHRFVQADMSTTRSHEGLGLGLSISKSYADMMGGKIEVESVLGKGSTFKLILPHIISPTQYDSHTETSVPVKADGNNILILVVEDDDISFLYINEILRLSNFNVIRARSGTEATQFCMDNREIRIVLMDIKLPEKNGCEASIEIKKIRPDIKIVAQTAYPQYLNEDSSKNCDFSDTLIKPFSKEALLKKIAAQLD